MKSLHKQIVLNQVYCNTRLRYEITNPVIRKIYNIISDNARFKVLNKVRDEISK